MKSYGHGWVSPAGAAVAERKPYTGPHRYSVVQPQDAKTVYVQPPTMWMVQQDPPMVRNPDHDTSHEGAAKASETKETVQRKLLAAFHGAGAKGFSDEEAAEAAGLTDTCYWKRCGELRKAGSIQYTGEKRQGRKGVSRKVSAFVE